MPDRALVSSVISDMVDRESWREAGGEYGRMCRIGGLLIITQTIANHNAIEDMLGNLRRHFKTPNLDARSYIDTPVDRTAGKQLDVKIARLDLEDIELEKALATLCAAPGVDLIVNRGSFLRYKDVAYEKVDVFLKNVTVKEALDSIFDSANNGFHPGVGYAIVGGRIELTPSASRPPVSLRIYDVRGLIAPVCKYKGWPASSADFRDGTLNELSWIIWDAVDPRSWCDAGGDSGIIHRVDGLLVVRQTTDNHEAIVELLEYLGKCFKGGKLEPYDPLAARTERLIRRKLARRTAKLELDNVGFATAIQAVLDASGLTGCIRYQPVETSLASQKVSLKLKNATFQEALDAVFAGVKNDIGSAPEYFIRNGVMKTGDNPYLGRRDFVRVYDIRDLIARKMKPTKLDPEGWEESSAVEETVKVIETLFRKMTRADESDSLMANSILGLLVVTLTEKNHAALAAVLEKMRAE